MSRLLWLNSASVDEAQANFTRCCGSKKWAAAMAAARPYRTRDELFEQAEKEGDQLETADWLEAFSHHPRIGDMSRLKERFGASAEWSKEEQGGIAGANEDILKRLAARNLDYDQKFGFVFLVCATGKTAAEMLVLLEARLPNSVEVEIKIAADEQRKITRLRLEKLLVGRETP